MLFDQPLPGTAELQARAVHQQVHRFGIAVRPRSRHLQGLRPAAQGGMVGNGEIETKQTDDGADQAFGLAQGQAEYGLERQRRRDRQRRVTRLTAPRGAGLGVPGRDRRLGKPDCQAPALAQGRIVFGPVRDPAPLFRDAVTAISIGLERHGGIQGHRRGHPPTPAIPACQPLDPCNKLPRLLPFAGVFHLRKAALPLCRHNSNPTTGPILLNPSSRMGLFQLLLQSK
jgi:hypothetical protein